MMASPLEDILDTIAQDVAALVPATRPAVRYYSLEDSDVPRSGGSSDRGFFFGIPTSETLSIRSASVSEVNYKLALVVCLVPMGQSPKSLRAAISQEARAIIDAINARSAWPSGTVAVLATNHVATEEGGHIELSIDLEITAEESDTFVSIGPSDPVVTPTPDAPETYLSVIVDATIAGDGFAEIASFGLADGNTSIWADIWNDVATADPANVELEIRSAAGGVVATLGTSSTEEATVGPATATVSAGTFRAFLRTDTITGIARCSRIYVQQTGDF